MGGLGGGWDRRGDGCLSKELLRPDRGKWVFMQSVRKTVKEGEEGVGCAWLRSDELEDFVGFTG